MLLICTFLWGCPQEIGGVEGQAAAQASVRQHGGRPCLCTAVASSALSHTPLANDSKEERGRERDRKRPRCRDKLWTAVIKGLRTRTRGNRQSKKGVGGILTEDWTDFKDRAANGALLCIHRHRYFIDCICWLVAGLLYGGEDFTFCSLFFIVVYLQDCEESAPQSSAAKTMV